MIKVKVKTTWQGKVGINEKYAKEALTKNNGLEIWVGSDVMFIKPEEVKNIVAKSDRAFLDKYDRSQPPYYLVYYKWKPSLAQGTLL